MLGMCVSVKFQNQNEALGFHKLDAVSFLDDFLLGWGLIDIGRGWASCGLWICLKLKYM